MTLATACAPELIALHQRLREVCEEILPEGAPASLADTGQDVAALLLALVTRLGDQPPPELVWLLLVAISASFPLDDEVHAARRTLELSPSGEATLWLLDWAQDVARVRESGRHELRLVRARVVVDVDFTAKNDLQTGIQRVVRRLAPRWNRDHDIVLAVWTDHSAALRALSHDETGRVLHWVRPQERPAGPRTAATVLVPWRSTVVLPEVPGRDQCGRLASLAQHSGNRVVAIGYDCIPVLSADLMPESEPTRFVRYLSLVKHADVVAGISASAAQEFRGFVQALPAQGLPGPRVVSCPLATDAPHAVDPGSDRSLPGILVVGSHEPRKNHLAVLHAAEVLWREGLRFELRFVGGSGWTTTAFDQRLKALQAAGRPVTAERGMDDESLWAAYRDARFTLFPSLHEGYGLPVAESLTLGTPVVATDYGSTAELAVEGGIVLVDPRDDAALVTVLRTMLVDDERLDSLRTQARERPLRTWEDYARDLWQCLVEER